MSRKALFAWCAVLFVWPLVCRGAGDDAPAVAPPAADSAQEQTLADLRKAKAEFEDLAPSLSAIADADFRKQEGASLRPVLHKLADLLDKLAAAEKEPTVSDGLRDDRCQYLGLLVTLGDEDARRELDKMAAADNSDTDKSATGNSVAARSVAAKSALALAKWWTTSGDAAAQLAVLDDYAAIAKKNSTSDRVLMTLAVMATVGPANSEVTVKVADVLRRGLATDEAKHLAAELDPSGAQRELLDKPLVVAGRLVGGGKLTTADMKGKVVLVDFWATWCGPCNAELPHVKELYQNYHAKGLEIVSLSCDSDDDTVADFVKAKQMAWPQMREESQTEKEPWHPLATAWGVGGIPTMFLIDKKGVLRSVDAREDTAAKVEKLLAE